MAEDDLQAGRDHQKSADSIEAHLSIVFAALAVGAGPRGDRLVDQEVRPDRPPLPDNRDPGGHPHLYCRRPLPNDLSEAQQPSAGPADVRTKFEPIGSEVSTRVSS